MSNPLKSRSHKYSLSCNSLVIRKIACYEVSQNRSGHEHAWKNCNYFNTSCLYSQVYTYVYMYKTSLNRCKLMLRVNVCKVIFIKLTTLLLCLPLYMCEVVNFYCDVLYFCIFYCSLIIRENYYYLLHLSVLLSSYFKCKISTFLPFLCINI